MPNLVTSSAIDTFMTSATNAAALANLGALPLTGGTLTGSLSISSGEYISSGLSATNLAFIDSDSGGSLVIETPVTFNTSISLRWPSADGTLLNSVSSLPAANLTGTINTARLPATITGLTSVTSTTFVGALTGTASGNLVSGGALGTPSSGVLTNCTGLPATIQLACSDETSSLTAGTAKVTFRMPYAMTLTGVRASVTTAPTGSTLIVNIKENGTTILGALSTQKLSIDATQKTSTTAANVVVIADSALANDAEITIDIDQIGSTIAGAGLKITLNGTRA